MSTISEALRELAKQHKSQEVNLEEWFQVGEQPDDSESDPMKRPLDIYPESSREPPESDHPVDIVLEDIYFNGLGSEYIKDNTVDALIDRYKAEAPIEDKRKFDKIRADMNTAIDYSRYYRGNTIEQYKQTCDAYIFALLELRKLLKLK